jgi:hypothetical protein
MSIRISSDELDSRIDRFLKDKAKRFPELHLDKHAEMPYIADRQTISWRRTF